MSSEDLADRMVQAIDDVSKDLSKTLNDVPSRRVCVEEITQVLKDLDFYHPDSPTFHDLMRVLSERMQGYVAAHIHMLPPKPVDVDIIGMNDDSYTMSIIFPDEGAEWWFQIDNPLTGFE
tara:strand:- start:109 stop:468 length:360 start_codon:yes stop_codon:yes gene_type:complete